MDGNIINEDLAFDRINYLLEDCGYSCDIRDMEELENFVRNKSNKRLGVYREITNVYNELSGGFSSDRLYGD